MEPISGNRIIIGWEFAETSFIEWRISGNCRIFQSFTHNKISYSDNLPAETLKVYPRSKNPPSAQALQQAPWRENGALPVSSVLREKHRRAAKIWQPDIGKRRSRITSQARAKGNLHPSFKIRLDA